MNVGRKKGGQTPFLFPMRCIDDELYGLPFSPEGNIRDRQAFFVDGRVYRCLVCFLF